MYSLSIQGICTVPPTYICVGLVELLSLVVLNGDVQLFLDCSETLRKLVNPHRLV
jgi:hypothetical protein